MNPVNERVLCLNCLRPHSTCYCKHVQPVETQTQFVILQHPLERKRTIGTARIAHRCLHGSILVPGRSFQDNATVNACIANPDYHCVILYPGLKAQNISRMSVEEKRSWYPQGKKLVVFVIDGTWLGAKSMLRFSPNLQVLPQISFESTRRSGYAFRRQPKEYCLSTIEAIYEMLGILEPEVNARNLLDVFSGMVDRQLEISALKRLRC